MSSSTIRCGLLSFLVWSSLAPATLGSPCSWPGNGCNNQGYHIDIINSASSNTVIGVSNGCPWVNFTQHAWMWYNGFTMDWPTGDLHITDPIEIFDGWIRVGNAPCPGLEECESVGIHVRVAPATSDPFTVGDAMLLPDGAERAFELNGVPGPGDYTTAYILVRTNRRMMHQPWQYNVSSVPSDGSTVAKYPDSATLYLTVPVNCADYLTATTLLLLGPDVVRCEKPINQAGIFQGFFGIQLAPGWLSSSKFYRADNPVTLSYQTIEFKANSLCDFYGNCIASAAARLANLRSTIENGYSTANKYPTANILAPDEISSCSDLTLDGSGSFGLHGRAGHFRFSVSSMVPASAADQSAINAYLAAADPYVDHVTIPSALLPFGTFYTFRVTVTNWFSMVSAATTTVNRRTFPKPDLSIPYFDAPFVGEPVSLRPEMTVKECDQLLDLYEFQWGYIPSIYEDLRAHEGPLFSAITDPTVGNKRNLFLHPRILRAGISYQLVLTASVPAQPAFPVVTAAAYITPRPSQMRAIIAGGRRRTVPLSQGIVRLDGSGSFDPDNQGPVTYLWKCLAFSPETPSIAPSPAPTRVPTKSPTAYPTPLPTAPTTPPTPKPTPPPLSLIHI